MPYEYTFPMPHELNLTGYPGLFEYANELTSSLFGMSVLVIIFIVSFMIGSKKDSREGYAAASFVTLIFSFFFGVLNLISGEIIVIFIVMTALSAFILHRGR